MVGQFVDVQLDASQLPQLVAMSLEVKNFTNEVDVEVDDQSGQPVDDSTDDVEVDVTETVTVQSPTPAGGAARAVHSGAHAAAVGAPGRTKKVLHFHTSSNGHGRLSGLPTGVAKVVAKRGTSVGRRGVSVRGNTTRSVKVRLH